MKELEQASPHLPHQGAELGELLRRVKQSRNGYRGMYYGISKPKPLPICINLELSDNRKFVIPYSNITEVTYDIEVGIVINTAYKQYQISGRKLDELFDYMQLFRVEYIKEHSGADIGEKGIFIGSINAIDR